MHGATVMGGRSVAWIGASCGSLKTPDVCPILPALKGWTDDLKFGSMKSLYMPPTLANSTQASGA